MPVSFTSTDYSVSATPLQLIQSALMEINALAAGQTPSGVLAQWGLEKLQRIIDRLNAKRGTIFNVNFAEYALVLNTQPITIGPGGNFNVKIRPVKLVAAALVLTSSSPNIDLPLNVQDDDWWAANQIKRLTSTLPTDVYYSPDAPLGNLYFWPIPTQANSVRLETWTGIAQAVALATAIVLPAAYWDFIVLTLAKALATSFGPVYIASVGSQVFQENLRAATKAVEGNNAQPPRISTRQPGMGGSGSGRTDFNFLTGKPW